MSAQIKRTLQQGLFLSVLASATGVADAAKALPPTLGFSVVHTLPHDASRFTQGLQIDHGLLYESAGRYNVSAAYVQDLHSGKKLHTRASAPEIFAEGLTVLGDRVYQLSWINHRGFIYDPTLKPVGEFSYDGEGWGLTHDGRQLIMSDGSARLRWLDPATFQPTREITVREGDTPVERLNELEYAQGLVWANVWMTDRIAAIDPASGQVRGWLDLAALKKAFAKPAGWDDYNDVLNGIAWDEASGHYFVTGKCWPVLFELIIEQPPQPQ